MPETLVRPDQKTETPAEARPFLKWAGGKGQLLTQFQPFFPRQFERYLEPFLGSGAVFFHLKPNKALLADSNEELFRCFVGIRDFPELVIEVLRSHKAKHTKEHYYEVRALNPTDLTAPERAARFIYLNKTCFNGLYRVNSKGRYNVPMGSYKNPTILDDRNLRAVSDALKKAQLFNMPFEEFCRKNAKAGDFIYFDPPYQPLSRTASFTGYTKDSFSLDDQRRLRDLYKELDLRGCRLMLSNSYCDEILDLYKDYASTSHTVYAKRAINCVSAKRGAIKELLVLNYSPHAP